jgi:hypothetical protein
MDAELAQQDAEIERGVANLTRGLSDGYSPAITAELARLEEQLATVRDPLKASDAKAVNLRIRNSRRFVETRLRDLSALWDGDARIAREEIAKHVGKIILKSVLRTYIATGTWDWLGD